MRFLATEFRSGGEYAVHFNAESWHEADRRCIENGWRLDGEVGAIIPASDNFGHREAGQLVVELDASNRATKQ